MIAIPIESDDEKFAVSQSLLDAKYFALIEKNNIQIVENFQDDEESIVNWLRNNYRVDSLITPNLGIKNFLPLVENELNIYFAGKDLTILNEVMLKHADGELPLITRDNFFNL